MTRKKLSIKNMGGTCCVRLVKRILEDAGIRIIFIRPGESEIEFDPDIISLDHVSALLQAEGFELIDDKEKHFVEEIKRAVIDLVHHTTFNAMIRNSDYLVQKFNLSYQHISSLFSKQEGITLEKFIINQKIEKVMELIQTSDMTLSEIAYMMGYSSVHYLSNQFRNVTGVSVTEFKKDPGKYRLS
jgi:AraC-like DNA-binding protein